MQDTSSKSEQRGDVNHPAREQWMAYLYGELPRSARAALAEHLKQCPGCAEQVAGWRSTLRSLDEWRIELPPSQRTDVARVGWGAVLRLIQAPRWAAAAVILLACGFAFGQAWSFRSGQLAALRQSVQSEVQQQLAAQLQAEWARRDAQLAQQQTDRLREAGKTLLAAADANARSLLADYASAAQATEYEELQRIVADWQQLDEQRQNELMALRRDLETVAVYSDAGLRQAEQQLASLRPVRNAPLP